MLNTYRVISLSLVTALFFAAPLLCIQPISFQIKRGSRLAVEHRQARRVEVEWQTGNNSPRIKPAQALARSLYRADNMDHTLLDESASPQAVIVTQEPNAREYQLQELDGARSTDGFSGATGVSDNHIYY
jgi:hypothetical protein